MSRSVPRFRESTGIFAKPNSPRRGLRVAPVNYSKRYEGYRCSFPAWYGTGQLETLLRESPETGDLQRVTTDVPGNTLSFSLEF